MEKDGGSSPWVLVSKVDCAEDALALVESDQESDGSISVLSEKHPDEDTEPPSGNEDNILPEPEVLKKLDIEQLPTKNKPDESLAIVEADSTYKLDYEHDELEKNTYRNNPENEEGELPTEPIIKCDENPIINAVNYCHEITKVHLEQEESTSENPNEEHEVPMERTCKEKVPDENHDVQVNYYQQIIRADASSTTSENDFPHPCTCTQSRCQSGLDNTSTLSKSNQTMVPHKIQVENSALFFMTYLLIITAITAVLLAVMAEIMHSYRFFDPQLRVVDGLPYDPKDSNTFQLIKTVSYCLEKGEIMEEQEFEVAMCTKRHWYGPKDWDGVDNYILESIRMFRNWDLKEDRSKSCGQRDLNQWSMEEEVNNKHKKQQKEEKVAKKDKHKKQQRKEEKVVKKKLQKAIKKLNLHHILKEDGKFNDPNEEIYLKYNPLNDEVVIVNITTLPKKDSLLIKNGNQSINGLWYFSLHSSRSDIRDKEKKSEWYFKRGQVRENKRDKAKWYFDYMENRDETRY